ncbi:DNA polymerase alpha subunit B isoform X2 [Chelonus insularis]|uniref:DNA polymerase alpha subunit B isoform X2 n=1 Tax=Chelonus insularis TaxID=460826 RepID=UPI00158ABEC6|nr:DNA polymerase alpha subunit B isoform X2 [Chelonus insularis]
MESEKKLAEIFKLFEYEVKEPDALKKCVEICENFNIDADGITDKWLEFIQSTEDDKNLDVTVQRVEEFEEWCVFNIKERFDKPKKPSVTEFKKEDEPKEKLDIDLSRSSTLNASKPIVDDEDILEIYGYKKELSKNIQQRSPGEEEIIVDDKPLNSEKVNSTDLQSSKSGTVLLKFGQNVDDWKNSFTREIKITKTNDPHVTPNEPFLYNQMSDFVVLNELCRAMAGVFYNIWSKEKEQLVITSNVREKTLDNFRTWGRITCDDEGKLNPASILLVGETEHWFHSLGEYEPDELAEGAFDLDRFAQEFDNDEVNIEEKSGFGDPEAEDIRKKKECIPLDVSRLQRFSFFPGQIVGVEGRNPTREILSAYKIIPGAAFGPEKPPQLTESIQIVIGAGPFSAPKSGNDYQPLYNLMSQVAQMEPNVLILIGPFIIDDGVCLEEQKHSKTYQEIFENLVTKIMGYVEGKCTQVVLIPSYEDAHHDGFYPTSEFSLRASLKKRNLHLMPDPCMIDIEGLIIGATSVDIIRHLSSEEISRNMRDKLGRLAEHLLLQSSFYPLHPPSPEVPLDTLLWADCSMMDTQPHILLVPSAMQHFHKWSHGTLILNPSKASKGIFTRLNIRPVDNQWSENCVDGEVLRI